MSLESVTDEKSSNLTYFYFHPPQKDFKASLLQLRCILADFQLYQGYCLGFFLILSQIILKDSTQELSERWSTGDQHPL